jgi:hypothetical protein
LSSIPLLVRSPRGIASLPVIWAVVIACPTQNTTVSYKPASMDSPMPVV